VTDGWAPLLIAASAAVLVAVVGGVATRTDAWYRRLRQPAWKPPDWAFGPVWALIFACTATAGVLAWNADAGTGARSALIAAYAVNGVLNMAWSVLFFRLRRPDWAFAEVLALWLSVLVVTMVTGRVSVTAGLLKLPYLAWVGTASYLNWTILRLNPSLREA